MEAVTLGIQVLQRLRNAGFGVALDDFGTGYSSLSYLQHIPATVLKIDKASIRDLKTGACARTLVQTIVDLAHKLQMVVVAEGVEDAETLELLAQIGCDRAQGYFIQRPQPVDAFLQGI